MSNDEIGNNVLDRINQEIEQELSDYDAEKEPKKEKKQFLTLQFISTFILVLLIIINLMKVFI